MSFRFKTALAFCLLEILCASRWLRCVLKMFTARLLTFGLRKPLGASGSLSGTEIVIKTFVATSSNQQHYPMSVRVAGVLVLRQL